MNWRAGLSVRGLPWTVVIVTVGHLPTFVLLLTNPEMNPIVIVLDLLMRMLTALLVLPWRGSRVAWMFFVLVSVLGVHPGVGPDLLAGQTPAPRVPRAPRRINRAGP